MYGSGGAKDVQRVSVDQEQLFDIIVESSLRNGSILELRSLMHCLSAKLNQPKFTAMLDHSLRRNPRAASQMPMAYNQPDAALLQEYLYEEGILTEIQENVTYDSLLTTLELESLIGMVLKLASEEGVVESFFEDVDFRTLYNEARSALDTLLNHAIDNKSELYDHYKGGAHDTHQQNTQTCCVRLCKLFEKIGQMAKVLVASVPVLAAAFVLWDIGLVAQLMFLFNIVFEVGWVTFAIANSDVPGLFSIGMFLWYEIHKFHTQGVDAVWAHENENGLIPGIPHAILPLLPNKGSMTTLEPFLITLLAFPTFVLCSAGILACCGGAIGGSILASSAIVQKFEELRVRLARGGYAPLDDPNAFRQQVERNRARIEMISAEQRDMIQGRHQREQQQRRGRVQQIIVSRRRDDGDSSGPVVVDITDEGREQPASSTGGANREERAEMRDADAIPDVRPSDVRITLDRRVTVDTQHDDIERQLSQLEARYATLQTLLRMQSDTAERTRTQLRLNLLTKRIKELRETLAAFSA